MIRSRLSGPVAALPARAAVRAASFTIFRLSGLVATRRACAIAFLPCSLRAMTTAVEITRRPRGLVAIEMPLKIGPIMNARISCYPFETATSPAIPTAKIPRTMIESSPSRRVQPSRRTITPHA